MSYFEEILKNRKNRIKFIKTLKNVVNFYNVNKKTVKTVSIKFYVFKKNENTLFYKKPYITGFNYVKHMLNFVKI